MTVGDDRSSTSPASPARGAQAAVRAGELQQRRAQLTSGEPCSPDTVARAVDRARTAFERAGQAHLAAAAGHRRAATAHLRAAEMHERALGQGRGDPAQHREAIASHVRSASKHDVSAAISQRDADADFDSQRATGTPVVTTEGDRPAPTVSR